MAKAGASGITKSWGTLGGNGKMHSFEPTGTQVPDRTSQEGHSGSRRDIAAKGGGTGLAGSTGTGNKDYAGTQQAGTSGATKTGGDHKFAEGGKTSMFGNRGSMRAEAGKSAP